MIKLTLMRHAKSDWQTDLPDIDRPLNERGKRDAFCMGEYLQRENLLPDKLIISSSERTRQTAEQLLAGADADNITRSAPSVYIDETLYLASQAALINAIQNHAQKGQHLLILAHNPGIEYLINYIASKPPALSSNGKLAPTCTAGYFHLDSTDMLRQPATAELKRLIRIKEISCLE